MVRRLLPGAVCAAPTPRTRWPSRSATPITALAAPPGRARRFARDRPAHRHDRVPGVGPLRGVDVHGVGYLVQASTRTLSALPQPPALARLLVETVVREDAILLVRVRRGRRARLVPAAHHRAGRRRQGGARYLSALSPANSSPPSRPAIAPPDTCPRRRPQAGGAPADRTARKSRRHAVGPATLPGVGQPPAWRRTCFRRWPISAIAASRRTRWSTASSPDLATRRPRRDDSGQPTRTRPLKH